MDQILIQKIRKPGTSSILIDSGINGRSLYILFFLSLSTSPPTYFIKIWWADICTIVLKTLCKEEMCIVPDNLYLYSSSCSHFRLGWLESLWDSVTGIVDPIIGSDFLLTQQAWGAASWVPGSTFKDYPQDVCGQQGGEKWVNAAVLVMGITGSCGKCTTTHLEKGVRLQFLLGNPGREGWGGPGPV